MGSAQIIKSTIQHHLTPFCCFSLKAKEVVTEWWFLCYVWTGPLSFQPKSNYTGIWHWRPSLVRPFFTYFEAGSRVALFKFWKFGLFWTSVCNFFVSFLKISMFLGPRHLVALSFWSITQTWYFVSLKYHVSVILRERECQKRK